MPGLKVGAGIRFVVSGAVGIALVAGMAVNAQLSNNFGGTALAPHAPTAASLTDRYLLT